MGLHFHPSIQAIPSNLNPPVLKIMTYISENCIPDPCQAVFNCAHQGYFLASALHGGFEALTIAFFALRPSAALLRAVQRFLLNSTFDDDLAWNSMGYGPWGCGWVKFQGRAFGG